MNISNNNICFSKIDNPIEAFITPPNDPLAGILMDQMPKDNIEIHGNIGDKNFNYNYSLKNEEIKMKGNFGGEGFEASGIFNKTAALSGTIGANRLFSTISPDTNGPVNSGMAGDVQIKEKISYSFSEGNFSVIGCIGEEQLHEVFGVNSEKNSVVDYGTIGGHEIKREAHPIENGFMLEGTIGGIPFKEYIISKQDNN